MTLETGNRTVKRTKKRTIGSVLAAFALVVAGSVAVAAPASAGERIITGGGPDGCFNVNKQRDSLGRPQVTVWNTCGYLIKVKVVWKAGPDSGCNTTDILHKKFSDSSSVTAKFDKLVRC